MPKTKGGKTKRRGKSSREPGKRAIIFKEHGQEYAQVVKMLGNGRVEGLCYDGKKRLCIIRGAMRKKVWIAVGDTILVSLREFQDNKADVIGKYSNEEARNLKMLGELPTSAKIGETTSFGDEDEESCVFDFEAI